MVTKGISTDWWKRRLKLQKDILAGRVYTPEEAKTEFEVDLEPGWGIKTESFDADTGQIKFTTISPEGWQIRQDETFVSPEGKTYTRAEIEEQQKAYEAQQAEAAKPPEGYVFDYATGQFVPATREQVAERERFYEQYPEVAPPGTPGKITPAEYEARRQELITRMFGEQPPEILPTEPQPQYDYQEALDVLSDVYAKYQGYTLEEVPTELESLRERFNTDPEAFLEDLKLRTTPENAERVLGIIGMTEEGILSSMDFIQQEERVLSEINNVIPAEVFGSVDEFNEWLAEDPGRFVDAVKPGGWTPEKEKLLIGLGFNQDDAKYFFTELPQLNQFRQPLMDALPLIVRPNTIDWAVDYYSNNADGLRRELITAGRNEDTMRLVRSLYGQMTEQQLKDYFSIDALVVEKKAEKGSQGLLGTFTAGVGDLVANVGGIFKWAGADGVGEKLTKAGQFMQVQAEPVPFEPEEFSWQQLLNPQFYATYGVRMLPTLMTLAVPAVGAYGLAGSIATRVGIGAFGRAIITGIGGGIMSRPVESALEAGASYDQARNEGLSHEDASRVADKVFKGNLWLVGSDMLQIAAAFMPTPGGRIGANLITKGLVTTSTVGGKLFFTGLTEGGEELYQEALVKKAMGDEQGFNEMMQDPEMRLVFSLGAIAGIGMGAGGDIIIRIQNRTINKLTPEQKADFDDTMGTIDPKLPEEVRTKMALDNLLEKYPELEKTVQEVIDTVEKEITFEQIKPKDEVERVALENLKEQVVPEVTPPVTEAGMPEAKIEIGDFVQLKGEIGKGLRAPRGFVEGEGIMGKNIPAWKVRQANGEITLIPKDEAIALGKIPEAKPPPVEEAKPRIGVIPSSIEEAARLAREAEAEGNITEIAPDNRVITTGREAPTPTEGATARVFSRIQTEYAEPSIGQKIKKGWHKFQYKMVDDLDPIRRITEEFKKGGIDLSIQENPYLLARLLRGVTSKATTFLEFGTFGKEFWKTDTKGKATPNYTGESLQNILNEVKDPVKWRDFSTYLTARRSVELSARDIETGIEATDAKASIAELEAKYPEFEGLAKRVYKYQDSLLVYANETGLISKELLGKLRKYGNYVPFYRVFNELQAKGAFGKKMANVANPIKKIKGSEREIINPLESIVKNTYVLISAADRNQVGIAIANLVDQNPELADVFERVKTPIARVAKVSAKELGVDIEGMTEAEEEQMVDIFRPSFFVRGDEVTVLIDGKKNYYKVDAELRDSLLRLDRESLGLLGKWLGAPARWLRAGATLSPDFMFRNPARDQMSAFAYSNYGFTPGIDFIRGLASIIGKDADYQLFRMSGAEHSMLVSMDRSYLQKTFKQIVGEKGFTEYVKHPLELFRIISELGEKATRLGEFKKGIQSGAVPLEAGYSARAVTLDFAQAGTTSHAINTFIAFFNANVRGWGKMVSSFKEHPIRTSAKVFAGITLPTILLWAVNHDEDWWKEVPQWQKDLFWLIKVGDNIYRIPKPFELGIIFGSIPERFLDWLVDKDPELMKGVVQTLIESGSPGFIPTAGLPILEWMTNYSFFRGRAIVPESRKAMPPELQYTQWSSEVSKKLGELLKLPPAQIDNLLFAWTGGLGRYATDIMDGILKGTGISSDIPQPSPTLADMPVIKAFVVRSPYGSSSEAVNDFYAFLEKYEAGEKYLKEMLVNGELEKFNKYKAAHPELFFFADFDTERYSEAIEKGETPKDVFYSSSARYLRRVASQLSEIWKKEDLIYKDQKMSSEQKRKLIDELEILKTDIARKAVDLLRMEEPEILQEQINERVNRLGELIEEAPVLSLEEDEYYDMRELNRGFKSVIESATVEELQKLEGINPLAIAWIQKEGVEKTIEPILNKQIRDIDFNLREGISFEDYYKSWQAGIITDSPLDKLSKRQIALLRDYEASEDKSAFLKGLSEEDRKVLTANPQKDWLRSHPKENAQLAVWGQASILTKEAYTEFKRLVNELDIPDNAMPSLTLPPEGSIDNYFEREQAVEDFGAMSAEAMVILARDEKLLEWCGLNPPEQPIRYYELKIKNRAERERWSELGDKEHPDYIDDDDERQAKFFEEYPETEYFDDERRTEAIANGFADNLIEQWVERGQLVDKYSAGSPKVKEWAFDNPVAYRKALEENILKDKGGLATEEERGHYEAWVEPAIRIQSKNIEQDNYWNELGDKTSESYIKDEDERREAFFKKYPGSEYFDDLERIEGYKAGFTETETNLWSERGRVVVKYEPQSAESKLWLVDHKDVWDKALEAGLLTDDGSDWNVPAMRIDVKWRKEDAEYDAIDPKERNEDGVLLRDVYLQDNEQYRKDGRRREAYQLKNSVTGYKFPTTEIENFVTYYEIPDIPESKRHDRFLIENPTFSQAMRDSAQLADLPKAEDVPHVQYDNIYDRYPGQFDEIYGLGKPEAFNGKYFIQDSDDREVRAKELRFNPDGTYTEFGVAELERNAYGLFVPQNFVPDYVSFYKIQGEPKPEDYPESLSYWEDNWFMLEHKKFHDEVWVKQLGKDPYPVRRRLTGEGVEYLIDKDGKATEIPPSREIGAKYIEYKNLDSQMERDQYRLDNPDIDEWGVSVDIWTKTMSEKRKALKMTTAEREIAELEESLEEWRKTLEEAKR